MRLCVFEDARSQLLEPITLTWPAFALWCGAERMFERLRRQFDATEVGFWLRPALTDFWRLEHPSAPINDPQWAGAGATVWINGRWLPPPDARIDATYSHVASVKGQIAYVVLPSGASPDGPTLDGWLQARREQLPTHDAGGVLISHLWDVVDLNGDALKRDWEWFQRIHGCRRLLAQVAVEGPREQLSVAATASVQPFVAFDVSNGPVMVDEGAVIQSFSRLEGPCYIGRDSRVIGATLRAGCTIGPCCRIGGEVEASVVQGHSNKAHDGFLGHSYVGAWVNLAAGTQTSNLRNDYDQVRTTVRNRRISTNRTKVGSFIGDHVKTGLGTLLNTGANVGVFSNLLPTGALLPQVIPSFCQVRHGQLHPLQDLRLAFSTAERMMQRRGMTLTEVHKDFYFHLFETTVHERSRILRESESRRLHRLRREGLIAHSDWLTSHPVLPTAEIEHIGRHSDFDGQPA